MAMRTQTKTRQKPGTADTHLLTSRKPQGLQINGLSSLTRSKHVPNGGAHTPMDPLPGAHWVCACAEGGTPSRWRAGMRDAGLWDSTPPPNQRGWRAPVGRVDKVGRHRCRPPPPETQGGGAETPYYFETKGGRGNFLGFKERQRPRYQAKTVIKKPIFVENENENAIFF